MNAGFGTDNKVESFNINGYKVIVSEINRDGDKYTAYNVFRNGFICRVFRNIEDVRKFCNR